MTVQRTSRELAERVEIDFQKHPNSFRRMTWWTALGTGVLALAWLAFDVVWGEQRIYEAGPVSAAHKMFENDCAKCHTEWSLGRRFLTMNDAVPSVSNAKCVACHEGPPHFVVATADPAVTDRADAHHGVACATCHREHRGKADLTRAADKHCVTCHGNLHAVHPLSVAYADDIRRFDAAPEQGAHPTFALQRLLGSGSEKSAVPAAHDVHRLIGYRERQGESPRWQDLARIRFNHAVHLKPGLPGKDGKPLDLSQDCGACHQPDADRRYMQPIRYEKHCQECHPLYFDANHPTATVPHETPEIVRGFLTDFYAIRPPAPPAAKPDQDLPSRPRPGRSYGAELTQERAAEIKQEVADAEQAVQQHRLHDFAPHIPINQFNRSGGCRYCHEVTAPADKTIWRIEPPQIPDRWLRHSRFSHDSHRILKCVECHRDLASGKSVAESKSTGDVLIPAIDTCRKCHAARPEKMEGAVKSTPSGARTDCVECHSYHKRDKERMGGELTIPEYFGAAKK